MNKEIELLETVELRFAYADTDEKLSTNLASFLCPVLLKLDSPHEAVRQKVISICTHINKRVKSSPNVLLPSAKIVQVFKSDAIGNLVKSFCLIYIEMAFQRITDQEAFDLLPHLIWNISKRLLAQQTILFQIILPIFSKYKEKKMPDGSKPPVDPMNFLSHPEDASFILTKFADIMLYSTPPFKKPTTANAQADSPVEPEAPLPRGLSRASLAFITNDGKSDWTTSPPILKDIKMGLLRFLTTNGLFPESLLPEKRFLVFLIATTDVLHEIISSGEDGLRRYVKPNLEDQNLINDLYLLYQGTQREIKNPQLIRIQAAPPLKVKILAYLSKSVAAANTFPAMLQVCFDALYGEESNAKTRGAGMSFVQWIARMTDISKLQPISNVLLSGLLKYINESTTTGIDAEDTLRAFAYESIALLSKRVPKSVSSDVGVLRQFFDALYGENRNVRVSVQDALGVMVDAYAGSDIKGEVEEVLLKAIEKPDSACRYVSAKFARGIFPFSHPTARYICLVATGETKLEIREEARLGLKFPDFVYEDDKEGSVVKYKELLPALNPMVELLYTKVNKTTIPLSSAVPGVKYVGGLSCEAYTRGLEFIRRLILVHADPFNGRKSIAIAEEIIGVDEDSSLITSGPLRANLKKYLKSLWEVEVEHMQVEEMELESPTFVKIDYGTFGINGYLELIERALKDPQSDALLQAMAANCLQELISLSPSSLCQQYYSKLEWLKSFSSSLKPETRLALGQVLSSVSTNDLHNPDRKDSFMNLVNSYLAVLGDTSKQKTIEAHHGAVVGLGFLVGRLLYRYPENFTSFIPTDQLSNVIVKIADQLDHNSALIINGACVALAEAGRYAPLPLITQKEAKKWNSVDAVIDKLTDLIKNSKEVKIQEAAITTLGHIALGSGVEVFDKVVAFFFTLPPIFTKQVEIHFTLGEALCACAGGFESTEMEKYLDISDVAVKGKSDIGLMSKVLEKIMAELLSPIPRQAVVRKAHCIWLLSLTKFCGEHEVIHNSLTKIHQAFSALLSDRDEFTQDVASKGIGLVYELGDDNVKMELVGSLVSTLTEGKKLAPQSVTGDTPLFNEGSLGNAPDGSALTTYQSILSLASDMNQPDMVYRFMNLASHNAIWNSRRGASLGFGSIMGSSLFSQQAEMELKPFMPTLIPRLYRYQFDPNAKVAEAMKNIWKSLIKEPKKSVDQYFDVIVKDLLKSIGDRMWRTREASCNALADLLHGREMEQIEPWLQDIWVMSFRALDDIKESVRLSALSTVKNLTNMTIRYCDPTVVSVSKGQKIMDIVMPFFLNKGLFSMAEEVRKFSLSVVLKLCKKGGVLLKPHLVDFVIVLLESLSSLEPQVMNYLTFHTDKYNFSQDQLDNSRVTASKMSPILSAVEMSIDQLDGPILVELIPKLTNLIRKAMGLPTKAGLARFIVSICTTLPNDFRVHADTVLQALSGVISDRSPPVRKSFATAVGYVINLSTDAAISRFLGHLRKLYSENDDEYVRSISGIVLLECAKHATDKMKHFQGDILPLTFFGCRDSNKEVKDVWTQVWDDLSGGSSSGLVKLYLSEIVALASTLLAESPSWPIKKQIGATFSDLATISERSFFTHLPVVTPLILESLGGRTWEGKESILEALCTIVITCKEWFLEKQHSAQLDEVISVSIREMKKNNKQYKRHALENVSKLFQELSIDRYSMVKDYLFELVSDVEDVDMDDARDRPLSLAIQANAFKSFGRFWSSDLDVQKKDGEELCLLLCKNMDHNPWNVRIAVLYSLDLFIKKLDFAQAGSAGMFIAISKALLKALEDQKYTNVREHGIVALKSFIAKKGTKIEGVSEILMYSMDTLIDKETNPSIRESLKTCRDEISGMEF